MDWVGNCISFLAVESRLTVLGWEITARGGDGADMGLAGCVSNGRGKGNVGVHGRVIGSLLEGAILEIHSCGALVSRSHKHNCEGTWSNARLPL